MPKILLPVTPSERFYDAVVGAADLLAREGGTVTFLFTRIRPPPPYFDEAGGQHESEVELTADDQVDGPELDDWRQRMIAALDDARALFRERGIDDDRIDHQFADFETPAAESIAEEAAAGAYDLVVLSRRDLIETPDEELEGDRPADVVREVQSLADEGVHVLVL
jgi:hypothetical protein